MSYVLAIDVGTSFTAAAVVRFGQEASPAPESLPLGLRGAAVPSVLYYPEEGPLLVGEAAERRGLDSPGRVVREFKRRVGDAVPISVGDLSLPAEDVFATMARWVVDRATEREGAPPSEVILTHPAAWGSHRISVILAALAGRGLDKISLVPEPEAAALYYASQVRVEAGSTIAVYDLGGGTFDTAVLRKTGSNRFQLVGRPEGIENLGGADFDAAVFRYVAEHTGDVLSALDLADAGVRGALGRLRRECVEAKEALSSDSEANISVLLPGFQQQIRLVRADFEALIEDSVQDTVEALEQSLAQLELEPADLSAVLLIGGSSRIPLVAQLISETLDRPIAVDADPKSSICLGAAVSAVLARAEAQVAGETPTEAAGTAVAPSSEGSGHVAHHASWSRKGTTAGGALSAAAAAAHGHGHGGAHAPKPTVRLTAIAAAAALVTVLTATAAQSPAGLSELTAIFVPGEAGAAAAADEGPAAADAGGSGGGAGAAAAGAPVAGIEAGVNKAAPASGVGLDVEASPTSRPSQQAAAGNGPAGSDGAAAGPGAAAGGSTGSAGGGAAAGTTNPTGTPTAIDPVTGQPVPTTDPVTGQPVPTTPVPTTDPTTGQPVPTTPVPDPTTPIPDPTGTQTPTPVTTEVPPPPPVTTEAPPPPPPVTTEAPPPPPVTTEAPPPPPPVTTVAPPPPPEPVVTASATVSAPVVAPPPVVEPAPTTAPALTEPVTPIPTVPAA